MQIKFISLYLKFLLKLYFLSAPLVQVSYISWLKRNKKRIKQEALFCFQVIYNDLINLIPGKNFMLIKFYPSG